MIISNAKLVWKLDSPYDWRELGFHVRSHIFVIVSVNTHSTDGSLIKAA